jgi:hypothetical protein
MKCDFYHVRYENAKNGPGRIPIKVVKVNLEQFLRLTFMTLPEQETTSYREKRIIAGLCLHFP